MIVAILNLLVVLILLGIVFWIAVAVFNALGIAIPQRIMQLVGLLVLVLVLLWFFAGDPVLINFHVRQ